MPLNLGGKRLQVGVDPKPFGHGPFLNMAKFRPQAGTDGNIVRELNLAAGGSVNFQQLQAAGRVDSNFELTDISGANRYSGYMFSQVGSATGRPPVYVGTSWVILWDGQTVTGVSGLGMTVTNYDGANRRATFTITSNDLVQWRLALNPAQGDGSPPTNIRVVEASKEALLSSGNLMDPDWIESLTGPAIIRLMDPMGTNNSEATDYTDLPTASFANWGGDGGANKITGGQKVGWPPQALCEIGNRTGAVIWVCIPHLFTDAAVTELAEYIRDNLDFSGTDIRVIFEYSNEDWNTAFDQGDYCFAESASMGWQVSGWWQWAGWRSAQCMELIRAAFGTDSGNKWAGALCSQAANTTVSTKKLAGVQYHIDNDVGVPVGTTVAKLYSFGSIANYFGAYPTTVASGSGQILYGWAQQGQEYFNQQVYERLLSETTNDTLFYPIGTVMALFEAHKTIFDAAGLQLLPYEGGSHLANAVTSSEGALLGERIVAFHDDWRSAQVTKNVLDAVFALTGLPASQFVHTGIHNLRNNASTCWGAYERLGQLDSERANACEAFNLGVAYVPGKRPLRVSVA